MIAVSFHTSPVHLNKAVHQGQADCQTALSASGAAVGLHNSSRTCGSISRPIRMPSARTRTITCLRCVGRRARYDRPAGVYFYCVVEKVSHYRGQPVAIRLHAHRIQGQLHRKLLVPGVGGGYGGPNTRFHAIPKIQRLAEQRDLSPGDACHLQGGSQYGIADLGT